MTGWLVSIAASMLIGLAGGAGACAVAAGAVRWYRISSFEGKAGYFVVLTTLAGAIACFLLALVTARLVAGPGPERPGFGPQLLAAFFVAAIVLGAAAALARGLADVPPRLHGHELELLVELRFPADVVELPNVTDSGAGFALSSLPRGSRTARKTERGHIHPEQFRREEGRWVLPASVPLFTGRGRRLIYLTIDGGAQGFLVPLPGRPKDRHVQWSDWLPRPIAGPVPPLTYRFRVRPEGD